MNDVIPVVIPAATPQVQNVLDPHPECIGTVSELINDTLMIANTGPTLVRMSMITCIKMSAINVGMKLLERCSRFPLHETSYDQSSGVARPTDSYMMSQLERNQSSVPGSWGRCMQLWHMLLSCQEQEQVS